MTSQVILPNSTVIGYTYDAKNRRVAKTIGVRSAQLYKYFNQISHNILI